MQSLINDLLAYSRINNRELIIEKICTENLFDEITRDMTATIDEKKATINYGSLPNYIYADRFRLKQLFQNIISNALKFVPAARQPIIEISSKDNTKNWEFSIKDNGIGINKNYQEKIFLLFKRLNNSTDYEGTGIGLALCKKVAEQHEGKIWFESKMEEGTTFYFTIKKRLEHIEK